MSRHTDALSGYRERLINRITGLNPHLAHELKALGQLPWYRISNEVETEDIPADADEAEVLIYDEIGGSVGVSAEQFVEDLGKITASKIRLRINSPGGSVFDSISIHNALVQHPAYVTAYVDGLAASGASIVALAGDRVVMMNGSQMMIHDAMGMEQGNAADMKAMSTFLNRQSDNIADMYAAKAGGEREEWRARMLAETWLFAAEAVELGLADEVFVRTPRDEPKPPAEAPEKEEDEEESEENEELPDDDSKVTKALQTLLLRKHDTSNRNWKYRSRKQAPAPRPISNTAVDQNLATLRTLFGKR